MIQATIIVMFIWVGNSHGGAATIQGFETLKSCTDAGKFITKFYDETLSIFGSQPSQFKFDCFELKR